MENIDKTSEKIIEATLTLLQKEGTKATTKKIAEEAGFNELTIFRKFKNKNNLIKATKDYYLEQLMVKLEEIFDFAEDENIEEFLRISFFGMLNLEESDFNILKIAMDEFRENDDNKSIIFQVTNFILDKLEEFFKLQIEKGVVKDIETKSIAIMCYNSLYQSVVLWKIYDLDFSFETTHYVDNILKMFLDGIVIEK